MASGYGGITAARIEALTASERAVFVAANPRSAARAGQGLEGFYQGVPMHWMRDWPMPFTPLVDYAAGASLTDIDGHVLADFCLGDTGAMFGHSPPAISNVIAEQAARGLTFMLPTEDAAIIGKLLRQRFGLPNWQVAGSATDANRFALRVARAATGRSKILVFNGCYHGTVDETFVRLVDGKPANRPGLLGQVADLTSHTRVVEFNDLPALAAALADREVACVITEPVLTNCCMVLPDPDFHAELRRLTRQAGTLLLIDETHTISTGPAGYSGRYGLEPDIFVLGKPVAGGVPAAIWGFTDQVAADLTNAQACLPPGHSGMGTTLSANALSLAAMRACLEKLMNDAAYAHMEALAGRLERGLADAIARAGLPWHVVRVGARVEFICAPGPLRNGSEADAAHAGPLEQAIHLALLNRGCLIAPFHNMMLVCPATEQGQVDRLINAFTEITGLLAEGREAA